MNRIRQIRQSLGISAETLAIHVGTTAVQIRRLETGARKLTVDWMQKIATALNVTPADLLDSAALAELDDDVIPAQHRANGASRALERRNIKLYEVVGTSITDSGIVPQARIAVDQDPQAIADRQTGQIVLCKIAPRMEPEQSYLALRVWIAPNMVVTNRPGSNLATKLDDPTLAVEIVGVIFADE